MSGSPGVERRSFLVAVGGALLGPLVLPLDRLLADGTPGTSPMPVSSPVSAAVGAEAQEVIVRLAARPIWGTNAKGPFMIWVEYCEDAGGETDARVMFWQPETEQEWEDAHRFCEAAMWRSYSSFAELQARPRQPGPFLIRWGLAGHFTYLGTADEDHLRRAEEERLRGPDGESLWTNDPRAALALSHDQAIRLTIRLQGVLGEPKPEELIYLEPVPLAEAFETHRRLSRPARQGAGG